MAHHKRSRPKNRRAGCLFCKPWKANGVSRHSKQGERFSDYRRWYFSTLDLNETLRKPRPTSPNGGFRPEGPE